METNDSTNQPLSFKRYSKKLEPLLTKPQNRVYTATILSFLVVSLFLWYAIRPTIQTILSLRREIIDNTQVSKLMEEKISALVEAQSIYQQISVDLPLLQEALPETPEPLSALLTIRSLAQETGASLSAIVLPKVELTNEQATSAAQTEQNSLPYTLVTLNIDGPYSNLKAFLDGIIIQRRMMSINSIEITPAVTNDSSSTLNPPLRLVVKLELYHYPKGEAL